MVLGRMAWDDSMYGNRKETACLPLEGADLAEQLAQVVERISGTYREAETPQLGEGEAIAASIPADPAVKIIPIPWWTGRSITGKTRSWSALPSAGPAQERVGGLAGLRDCTQALIALQMDATAPDSAIQEQQAELNRRYDAFTARYGLISDRANRLAFADDSSDQSALRPGGPGRGWQASAQSGYVHQAHHPPGAGGGACGHPRRSPGPVHCRKGRREPEATVQLTGKSPEELTQALQGVIFPVPGSEDTSGMFRYETADAYLSGNVRQKLRDARQAAESDARFAPCVAALEHAQPKEPGRFRDRRAPGRYLGG